MMRLPLDYGHLDRTGRSTAALAEARRHVQTRVARTTPSRATQLAEPQ